MTLSVYPGRHRRTCLMERLGCWAVALVQATVIGVLGVSALALAVPHAFGWQAVVVHSGSMGATAPAGSVVLARPVPGMQVGIGDVVVMQHPQDGSPVIHRVIAVKDAGTQRFVQTRGDANGAVDPDVYLLPAQVTLSVAEVPRVGYVVGFVQTPVGAWVITGLAGLLVLSALRRRVPGTVARWTRSPGTSRATVLPAGRSASSSPS
jgi:signal peptidase I